MPDFETLRRFLESEMRMSHVYQPVMLRELLRRQGAASTEGIASALLLEDQSQLEYYELIVRNMVGRVLTKNRGITEKRPGGYVLKDFADLTSEQIGELIAICDQKLSEYLTRRTDPWSHRRKSVGYIPGTARYEVLKRAHFRCELCGVSAEHKALEVDHIQPRNEGGTDHILNLQALCYSCNATKRDRDNTSFRDWARHYDERQIECRFCDIDRTQVVASNELCVAVRDRFPVTELHTLIVPRRHVQDYFELFAPERNAIQGILTAQRDVIIQTDPTVSGFNVGINCGEVAGQTIMHTHVHLIPRREADTENPSGGVRGVIPARQSY
jgi:diadenosine tetraphosphate (Ap4A) HIT family hydrolase